MTTDRCILCNSAEVFFHTPVRVRHEAAGVELSITVQTCAVCRKDLANGQLLAERAAKVVNNIPTDEAKRLAVEQQATRPEALPAEKRLTRLANGMWSASWALHAVRQALNLTEDDFAAVAALNVEDAGYLRTLSDILAQLILNMSLASTTVQRHAQAAQPVISRRVHQA